MKKGFTLIELLAVIVILAIIAIIAAPIILNIINDSRLEGRIRSAESLTHSMETAYLSAIMLTEKEVGNSQITIKKIIDRTEIDNEETRDNESITTVDGVKCTITGDYATKFIVTCVDTKSNNHQLLTKELVGKDETAQSQSISYQMLASPNMVGQGAYGVFSSEANLNDFDRVTVDGQSVNSSDYITQSGSTIIRLKPSFTSTLSKGNHTIEIISNDGKATANFEITDGIAFTISGVGTFKATEGMTWADWILSYGVSTVENGYVWVETGTLDLYVDIGNGLWINNIRNQKATDVITSTTYEIGGPM